MWGPIIEWLQLPARVVLLGLPGHYPWQTPDDWAVPTTEELVRLTVPALEAIAKDAASGKVSIVGHSFGGLMAVALAGERPDLVERIVAICGAYWGPPKGILGLFLTGLRRGIDGPFNLSMNLVKNVGMLGAVSVATSSGDAVGMLRDPLSMRVHRAWHPSLAGVSVRNLAQTLRYLDTCDLREQLAGLTVPLLSLDGSKDPIRPVQQAHWLAANQPNATVIIDPDVGHHFHLEKQDAFKEKLFDFLDIAPPEAKQGTGA